jgi:hypothetical protein
MRTNKKSFQSMLVLFVLLPKCPLRAEVAVSSIKRAIVERHSKKPAAKQRGLLSTSVRKKESVEEMVLPEFHVDVPTVL